jgi:hypothetical protein
MEPPKKPGDHWANGLSNGYTTFFFFAGAWSGFPFGCWADSLLSGDGYDKWGSGPAAAFMQEDESPRVFGAVVNNIWSVGSPPGTSDWTNQLFLDPFFNYHFADGWFLGSSPEITANWIASGGKWTVPVRGGFGKAFYLG